MAMSQLDLLLELDRGNWVEYRYQKADVLANMDEIVLAKQEILGLLEAVPNYWKAQELLLELVGRGEALEPEVLEASEPEAVVELD
jgi:hypothetical protein